MKIYLDTNVFYNAYSPVEEAETADYVFNLLGSEISGITSEWTITEMFRAYKKQANLNTIDISLANMAIDFFIADINQMVMQQKLALAPVKSALIYGTRAKIFNNNLYVADAIHVLTAESQNAQAFISYDSDFKKYVDIPVINPGTDDYKDKINELRKQD